MAKASHWGGWGGWTSSQSDSVSQDRQAGVGLQEGEGAHLPWCRPLPPWVPRYPGPLPDAQGPPKGAERSRKGVRR